MLSNSNASLFNFIKIFLTEVVHSAIKSDADPELIFIIQT